MLDFIKTLTKELTLKNGIPSHEDNILNYIENKVQEILKEKNENLEVLNLNNLDYLNKKEGIFYSNTLLKGGVYLFNKNPGNDYILFDAHMDEVGFIVQYISPNGFVKLLNYGGIDSRVVYSSLLKVIASDGKEYTGVVGILPPHVMGATKPELLPLDKLWLDLGFKNAREVYDAGIRVGSPVYFVSQYLEMPNNRFSVKAIDDRLGVALLIDLIKQTLIDLYQTNTGIFKNYNIAISFSTQEEGGLRGISSIVEIVKPKYAFAIESTTACDTQGVSKELYITELEKGVAFTVADRYIYVNPQLLDFMINVAKQNNIKYQFKTPGFGGTNAGEIFKKHFGIKTGIIAVPVRYLHSAVSMASWLDVEETSKFLNKILILNNFTL